MSHTAAHVGDSRGDSYLRAGAQFDHLRSLSITTSRRPRSARLFTRIETSPGNSMRIALINETGTHPSPCSTALFPRSARTSVSNSSDPDPAAFKPPEDKPAKIYQVSEATITGAPVSLLITLVCRTISKLRFCHPDGRRLLASARNSGEVTKSPAASVPFRPAPAITMTTPP